MWGWYRHIIGGWCGRYLIFIWVPIQFRSLAMKNAWSIQFAVRTVVTGWPLDFAQSLERRFQQVCWTTFPTGVCCRCCIAPCTDPRGCVDLCRHRTRMTRDEKSYSSLSPAGSVAGWGSNVRICGEFNSTGWPLKRGRFVSFHFSFVWDET